MLMVGFERIGPTRCARYAATTLLVELQLQVPLSYYLRLFQHEFPLNLF